jgi:hypothetical protein
MPAIVEFPTIVEEAVKPLRIVFSNEPERPARRVPDGPAGGRAQDRLGHQRRGGRHDRPVVSQPLDHAGRLVAQDLNERRLAWLHMEPSTRYSAQGVIRIDNTLVDHEGKRIEDAGWFWDHADKRHLIAHDYLIANYVRTSLKHYRLELRRFRKRDLCDAWRAEIDNREGGWEAAGEATRQMATFRSHTELFKDLVDWTVEHEIPGDFAFDCYFTNAEIPNHINAKERG